MHAFFLLPYFYSPKSQLGGGKASYFQPTATITLVQTAAAIRLIAVWLPNPDVAVTAGHTENSFLQPWPEVGSCVPVHKVKRGEE